MSVVLSDAWQQRFGGTARLYGEHALSVFARAHCCVVGIGGVGSWAAEALVRTGIGAITLIDTDDVCVTNINRQIHALRDTVGQAKADVMAERLRRINPECRITTVDDFVTPDNVAALMSQGFDYVLDAAVTRSHWSRQEEPVGRSIPHRFRSAIWQKQFRIRWWLSCVNA